MIGWYAPTNRVTANYHTQCRRGPLHTSADVAAKVQLYIASSLKTGTDRRPDPSTRLRPCGGDEVCLHALLKLGERRKCWTVDELFALRNGSLVEVREPASERLDKVIQLTIGQGAVDISVVGCEVAGKVVRTQDNF